LELVVEFAELGDGLLELSAGDGRQDGGWNEVKGEGELRRREAGHGLHEYVGDNLNLNSVGVELVPVTRDARQRLYLRLASTTGGYGDLQKQGRIAGRVRN
jgi:hypothetical protein